MPTTQLNANNLLLTHINLAFWDMKKKKKKKKKEKKDIPTPRGSVTLFYRIVFTVLTA